MERSFDLIVAVMGEQFAQPHTLHSRSGSHSCLLFSGSDDAVASHITSCNDQFRVLVTAISNPEGFVVSSAPVLQGTCLAALKAKLTPGD